MFAILLRLFVYTIFNSFHSKFFFHRTKDMFLILAQNTPQAKAKFNTILFVIRPHRQWPLHGAIIEAFFHRTFTCGFGFSTVSQPAVVFGFAGVSAE